MLNINWIKSMESGFQNDPSNINRFVPFLWEGSPYYLSTYMCPDCGNMALYKLRVRGAKTVFNNRQVELFNLFTCPMCRKFYASTAVGPLTQNNITLLSLKEYALVSQTYSQEEYMMKLGETLRYFSGN